MTLEAETAYDVAVVGGGAAGLSAARVRPPSGTGPRARSVRVQRRIPCLRYPTLAIRPQRSLCVDLREEA